MKQNSKTGPIPTKTSERETKMKRNKMKQNSKTRPISKESKKEKAATKQNETN